ncbi:hemerythrin domain-containing protein [Actinacidiphila sp. ITFR-21]|uniref:hemerythrin domain-containing protein n=1 Tax=Actinacidiphila sp. ITFR-21 TaxID=3075199 RepID=UPI00288960FF|nr:hemerythrin domain-containing protein [Streptomyces sp. ITFR-21]WNI19428.1 hemerythrin domain-containing protein [Streptomyces sp. ITFR-21]
MSSAEAEREAAAMLPNGDVVALLLEQHARIRGLFAEIAGADAGDRKRSFDELRALLAVHEAAEELVVRPVAEKTAGEAEADARNQEEKEAGEVLRKLEGMDVADPEFLRAVAEFEQAVSAHADHEEQEEFPAIVAQRTVAQRGTMGDRLRKAEHLAPTHPHPMAAGNPTAVRMTGPFAAMIDKARDAIGR